MNDLGRIERIERALEAYIANCSAPEKLKQSMAYSLLAGWQKAKAVALLAGCGYARRQRGGCNARCLRA